jgi:large subunit ribosomal protein L21
MNKYAVIKFGSRQYTVYENDVFEVERQARPLKAEVLFYSDGTKTLVGEPLLKDVVVKMTLLDEKRTRKIVVGRFKSKSRYKKKRGHRQEVSVVRIDRIGMVGDKEEIMETKKPVKIVKEVETAKAVKPAKVVKTEKKEVKKEKKEKTAVKTTKKKAVKKTSKKLAKKVK